MVWDVHIYAINSLAAVVLKVILLKSYRHGYTKREISKNTKPPVVDWSSEGEIVGELMDS
jgi:hypothetical protein